MKNLFLIHKIDVKESVRSKWFLIYTLVFGSIIAIFFADGVGQYLIYDFLGLNKMLLMYIQVSLVVLPIFVLISTITSIIKDKENNTLEYMLVFPVSLKQYYWGKFIGRFITMVLPLLFALGVGIVYGLYQGLELELQKFYIYILMLIGLSVIFFRCCFLRFFFFTNARDRPFNCLFHLGFLFGLYRSHLDSSVITSKGAH